MWFIDKFIRIEQRNKRMKKLVKKHIAWKKKILAKYAKECEQYIHEKRDWEMSIMIQTWNKFEIFWSIQISSFNHLLNLVEFEHAMQEDYITLMKNENMSRTVKNVYEDEIEKKISSDFQSEKSDNSMNDNIMNDSNESASFNNWRISHVQSTDREKFTIETNEQRQRIIRLNDIDHWDDHERSHNELERMNEHRRWRRAKNVESFEDFKSSHV